MKYINEFAEKWLKALESGKYEQGKGFLAVGGKFCCLGVAEELAGTPWEVFSECRGRIYHNKGDNERFMLTSSTQKKLGRINKVGRIADPLYVSEKVEKESLADAHDAGAPFKQIAATLRKQPELFFHPLSKGEQNV